MKQYRFDYHSEYGFLGRWFVEAESEQDAEKKAIEQCRMTRWKIVEGSLKEWK